MHRTCEQNINATISLYINISIQHGTVLDTSSHGHGTQAIIQTHKSVNERNMNVQTNRHGLQNKGCKQMSADGKHYLISKLRPPCP